MKKLIKEKIDTMLEELSKLDDKYYSHYDRLAGYIIGAYDSGGMTKEEYKEIYDLIEQIDRKHYEKVVTDIDDFIKKGHSGLNLGRHSMG